MDMPAPGESILADPLEPTLGFQLRRASAAASAALEQALRPIGLRTSEAYLLQMIGANPGATQSAIGRALRVQPANLVPLIARLHTLGALERTPGRGRAIALSLSAAGVVLNAAAGRALADREARLARSMTAAEQAAAVALLRRLTRDACREG